MLHGPRGIFEEHYFALEARDGFFPFEVESAKDVVPVEDGLENSDGPAEPSALNLGLTDYPAMPLPDDFGVKFATEITLNGSSVVMLFARGDVYQSVYEKVCDYGVFAVRKPVQPITVAQALDWLKATRERLRGMEKRVVSIRDKMEEIKIVNRAKWALINSCNMTEADAHRYIEKQAMDRCVTRREIAETIIKTYK